MVWIIIITIIYLRLLKTSLQLYYLDNIIAFVINIDYKSNQKGLQYGYI